MKHAGKRVLSTVCALALLAAMLPAQAFAVGPNDTDSEGSPECTCTVPCTEETPDPSCPVCQNDVTECQVAQKETAEVSEQGEQDGTANDELQGDGESMSGNENEDDTGAPDGEEEPEDTAPTAEQLKQRINALPAADALATLDAEARDAAYQEACDIEDALASLSEEEKVTLDTAKLDALFTWFNEQVSVQPEEETTTPSEKVAQIGNTPYATLDDAIKEATDGATIELLADATTTGLNLSKALTIKAADGLSTKPTITFTQYGIALWGKALTFENCNVVMNGIGSTPYTGEWNWMSICASKDASLTLDNVEMTMDATGTTNSPHAIYFCNNNVLNLQNGTKLTIKNYANDALEWDGGNGGYNVNITDSTFVSDHNRSGFTGTFYATITNSKVDVINSTGNGSNGSHFIIKDSDVTFSDNGSHGLSAGELVIDNSTVKTENNHGMGISVNNNFTVENGSVVTVTGNADNSSYGYAAVRLYNNFNFKVDNTSKLYINNNHNTGLYVRQGNLAVEDGAVLEITGNKVTHNALGGYGGGVYVGYGDNYDPTVTLPADAKIYNNHAKTGGDDIYVSEGVNGPTLTFGKVGTDWKLDDCEDIENCSAEGLIDGWYDDSEDARWNAHASKGSYHIEEFTNFNADTSLATVTGLTCLKAAHDAVATIQPADITIYMGGNGYSSVIDAAGESGTQSDGLPEPGFYITLPEDINSVLSEQTGEETVNVSAQDLSKYITKIYSKTTEGESREWALEKYGDQTSVAYNKFVYRIIQQEGQPAVRLQFTDDSGTKYTSDTFAPQTAGALNTQYTMGIYPGLVDTNQIKLEIKIGENTYPCTVKLEDAKLNIRYVTGNPANIVTDVVTDITTTTDRSKAYALVPSGTTFTINDSQIDVTNAAAPSLLFDDVVTSGNTTGAQNYDEQLKEEALKQVTGLSNPQYQAKYLDLVDANNGNVWLRSSQPVTVYWPYPAGTDKNTTFHLVHFQGLNREMSNGDISGKIDSAAKNVISVETTDYGIKFTAESFSPFVLLWDGPTSGGNDNNDNGNTNPAPASTPAPTAAPVAATPAPAVMPAAVPQTSDDMPLGALTATAVAAAAAFVALLVVRKRRHGND